MQSGDITVIGTDDFIIAHHRLGLGGKFDHKVKRTVGSKVVVSDQTQIFLLIPQQTLAITGEAFLLFGDSQIFEFRILGTGKFLIGFLGGRGKVQSLIGA